MKKFLLRQLSWIAAATVFVTGLVSTVGTLRLVGKADSVVRNQADNLQTLEQFADRMDGCESARATYERVPGGRAVRLETILRETLDAESIEEIREHRVDIGNGWVLRKKEVILGETPMTAVMAAIRKAEAQRPPWLLAECVIRAAPLKPGHARVVLAFEVLERSSAASPWHASSSRL